MPRVYRVHILVLGELGKSWIEDFDGLEIAAFRRLFGRFAEFVLILRTRDPLWNVGHRWCLLQGE